MMPPLITADTAELPRAIVELERAGNMLGLSSPGVSELVANLGVPTLEYRTGSSVRVGVHRKYVPLVDFSDRANLGLLPCIATLARHDNKDLVVRTIGAGRAELAPPQAAAGTEGWLLSDPSVPEFVHQNETGIVEIGPGVTVERIIAQLALAFPAATIAVAAGSTREIRRLKNRIADRLKTLGIDPDESVDNCVGDPVKRIVVSTPIQMAGDVDGDPVDIEKRHIVVLVSAIAALGSRFQLMLSATDFRGRVIGLLPSSRQLSVREQVLLFITFGPRRVCIPAHGFTSVPVRIIRQKLPILRARHPPLNDPVQVQRRGIWLNHVRNRKLHRLAQLLVAGDRERLADEFPGAATGIADHIPERVVIVVDAVEHAVQLALLMTDAEILTEPSTDWSGLDAQLTSRRLRQRSGSGRILISTEAGLARIGRQNVPVILYAGASCGLPAIPAWLLMNYANHAIAPLYLVDFSDRHHHLLARNTKKRKQQYLRAGWLESGIPPENFRLAQFLRQCIRNDAR